MPEPQLLSIQPLPQPPSPTPKPQGSWPFVQPGLSVCTAAHRGKRRGRQELRKELDAQGKKKELGFVKNIFIINKQGCKRAGEAAELITDRKTWSFWLPAPALMASISASGRTSWAQDALWETLPRADAGYPAPARCVGNICKVHCLQ